MHWTRETAITDPCTGLEGGPPHDPCKDSILSNSPSKTWRLHGHIPAFRKPFTAVLMVEAARNEAFTSFLTWWTVIVWPGCVIRNFSVSMLYQFFSDRKKLTSSGCIVCVVCGGNDNMVTPLSRASRMASRLLVCEAWPSRRSRCLFSIEEFTDVLKCFSHIRKQSLSIQLESVQAKIVPAGASVFKVLQIRFRLNTSMGAR